MEDVDKLKKQLEDEKLKTIQEREKYNKMVEKMQRDVSEAQQNVYEESQSRQRLQMEMDAKDSEIEQLRQKLSMFSADSAPEDASAIEESPTTDLKFSKNMEDVDKLKRQLEDEKLKKIQAMNKLAEIMNRKEFSKGRGGGKDKASSADLGKKERELRRAQEELTMEREKYNKMVEKMQRDVSEAQQNVYEESQSRQRLQMEMDAKDSEIEQLRQKLSMFSADSASINSGSLEDASAIEESPTTDALMEGWLATPIRQNIKKYGWRKQYVVVSSRKVLFYNTENDKMNADPIMVLDIDKLVHVRPVTQGDVYRADAKDIPRIFQILYTMEGENRKPEECTGNGTGTDRSDIVSYKGHDFLPLTFRTPTSCDSCHRPVWHVLHPPQAMECRRCHVKVHREHYDNNEEFIAYCKVNFDSSIQAKEMLLLAETAEKQKMWIAHMSKKISKKGIVSSGNLGTLRGSKQYSSYGPQQRSANKSATLPPNARN